MRRLLASFFVLLLLAVPALGPALGQAVRGIPDEAGDPLREALRLLETVKGSTLEPGWRANAAARAARTLARAGDNEAARVRAQEAALAGAEDVRTPPLPGLSEGAVDAILVQVYADLKDTATAQGIAQTAMAAIERLGDAATRASLYAYIAQGLAQIGATDQAGEAVLQSLRSASVTPLGRERVNALSALILAQAKLGQLDEARAVLDAARQSLDAVTQPVDRTAALANLARAEAALGDRPAAEALVREAMTSYGRTQGQLSEIQRTVLLGLLALAQNDAGDKSGAQTTLRNERQVADSVRQIYDRLQAMLTLADTALQIAK